MYAYSMIGLLDALCIMIFRNTCYTKEVPFKFLKSGLELDCLC